jgi:SAM-dependent methyltransferase
VAPSRSGEPQDCCFDGWARVDARRARRRETSARITAALVAALDEAGLKDRLLLDVGCGSGDLALAALARGAVRAVGFDLGAGAIRAARSLAAERDLADRVRFEVGDGASIPLPHADVVSLNRVLCCYPDVGSLLANTLDAAGTIYGFTAPHDRGVVGAWNRVSIRIGNAWYRLRERKYDGFRAFVHDLGAVDERVRAAGFRPMRRERRGSWDLAVYQRR